MTEDRETGTRLCVDVMIALPENSGAYELLPLRAFESWLNAEFGGFTRLGTTGGWADQAGKAMTERGVMYRVSIPAAITLPRSAAEKIARRAAVAGLALGQEWVHVTSHWESAHHIRCASVSRD